MGLSINETVVRGLISRKFGNVDRLILEWEERIQSGTQRLGRARNRGTVYRWLADGLPTNREDILGFAGLLDIDPIALLKIDEAFVRSHYARERRLFMLGALERSRLAPFWQLYLPSAHWPDQSVAYNFFSREWTRREFEHVGSDAGVGHACLEVLLPEGLGAWHPQVLHFAYRRRHSRDGMWRPFGSVVCSQGTSLLISESGDLRSEDISRTLPKVQVETFFGPGPAEFRIASLHSFEVNVVFPSPCPCALRFEA